MNDGKSLRLLNNGLPKSDYRKLKIPQELLLNRQKAELSRLLFDVCSLARVYFEQVNQRNGVLINLKNLHASKTTNIYRKKLIENSGKKEFILLKFEFLQEIIMFVIQLIMSTLENSNDNIISNEQAFFDQDLHKNVIISQILLLIDFSNEMYQTPFDLSHFEDLKTSVLTRSS